MNGWGVLFVLALLGTIANGIYEWRQDHPAQCAYAKELIAKYDEEYQRCKQDVQCDNARNLADRFVLVIDQETHYKQCVADSKKPRESLVEREKRLGIK